MSRIVNFGSPGWAFAGVGNARSTLRLADPGFPTGVTIYVDENHAQASDTNTGLDPNWPKLTIQGGINAITRAGTTVAVAPGTYEEAVYIPVTYDNCRLIGMGTNPWQTRLGQTSGTVGATSYALQVRAEGWEIANFWFAVRGSGLGVNLLGGDNAAYTTAGVAGEAQLTHIHDCVFRGNNSPNALLTLDGAPWYVTIENNVFINVTGTAACGIKVINTSNSVPQKNLIRNNVFQSIGDDGLGFSYYGETVSSMFIGNIFGAGSGAASKFINVDGLGTGTYNLIVGNIFCTNTGGTQEYDTTNCVGGDNTNSWVGNFAEPRGGASDTATYGITHAEPDAAA